MNDLYVVVPLKLHQVIQDVVNLHVQNGPWTSKQWCYCSLGPLVPDSPWSPGREVPLTELPAAISLEYPFFIFPSPVLTETR